MNNQSSSHAARAAACCAVALAAVPVTAPAAERPVLIERATVLSIGEGAVFGGLAFELGREADPPGPGDDLEYDNTRLGPFGARLGLGEGFEVGGALTANLNREDDNGAPDDSGLAGITLYGKLAATDHVAVTFGTTVAGADDVGPTPNDGLDFFVNVPMQRSLGMGLLYGELGMTIQADDIGGTFINYGVGYALPVNDQLALNAELVGEESNNAFRSGNTMSLVLGGNFQPDRDFDIAPYVSLGLYDAAPAVALGASVELRL